MKKNTKKKIRDIRNAFVMTCVMVAMLSTASYAWFTLTDSPTVTGLQMTAAASGGGLEVANVDQNGNATDYFSSIIIKDTNEVKMLRPVTPNLQSAGMFKSPVYTGEEVTGLAEIPVDETNAYVAKYTYWLKSTAQDQSGTVGVGIICGAQQNGDMGLANDQDGGAPLLNGSFVRKSAENESPDSVTVDPSNAVRVGLVITDTTGETSSTEMDKIIIWEPNADNMDNSTRAESTSVDATIEAELIDWIKVQSNVDGTIVKGGSGNISDALFTMDKGKEVKIEMYVWLQGSDLQCGNEIQAGNLEAQIQFTTIDATGAGGGQTP